MVTVTGIIRRSADACWKTLVDPDAMTGWMPNLRRARGAAAPGFARVEAVDQGARITYAIEDTSPKSDHGDLDALVAQFASWMHAY
jgi:hypothetical protein